MSIRPFVTDTTKIKANIHQKVMESVKKKFPVVGRKYTAVLDKLSIESKNIGYHKQHQTLLNKGSLFEGVFADISIIDNKTKKVVGSLKKHRLLNIPYFTQKYTFMVSGSEYNIMNQLRQKPGVYTRKRGNDELESSFNLGKGVNFKLVMDPSTGIFTVAVLNKSISFGALLDILGADKGKIKQVLGEELYRDNMAYSPAVYNKAIDHLYDNLVSYKKKKTSLDADIITKTLGVNEKITGIKQYFSDNTQLDPETTKITLGTAYDHVTVDTLLDAAGKMLRLFRAEDGDTSDIDDRDNLEFQKVLSVEDIMAEVLDKEKVFINRIKGKLDGFNTQVLNQIKQEAKDKTDKTLKTIFTPTTLSNGLKNFITTSSISRLPSQINPMEIVTAASAVTKLGEGAITSEQAVPDDSRAVNYSYMGVMDPVETPESSKIGIDTRFSVGALKGDDGEIYRKVVNAKTGKVETKRIIELNDKYVEVPSTESDKGGAIGAEMAKANQVFAIHKGKIIKVPKSKIDYFPESVHSFFSIANNSIPFLNSNQANRLVMGDKHVQQALPLTKRETRLITSATFPTSSGDAADNESINTLVAKMVIPSAKKGGKITKITEDEIHIKTSDGSKEIVPFVHNYPLSSKTMLHNTLSVKVGDTVKAGQALGESNFTKDGELALGTNLHIAYAPYFGYNHEDGVVISESAAEKLKSEHIHKVNIVLNKIDTLNKSKFIGVFPVEYTKAQLGKLDDNGVVRKGTIVEFGDPLALIVSEDSDSKVNQVLGNLHKSLVRPYRNNSRVYDLHYPGEIIDAQVSRNHIMLVIKYAKKAGIGDKLSGSYGNKGVIAKVVPDADMLHNEKGEVIDAVLTPAGVPGRINPAQTLETGLGKVAKKTGKRYKINNFGIKDYTKFVKDEMKKHNVPETDTLIDPQTGKKIPKVFTGYQYIHKGFKTSDTGFSARGIEGAYDQDEAPVGSGDTGPKGLGSMEVNALVGHNARAILHESSVLRSSKNTDFWSQYQNGLNPEFPMEKKTFGKFKDILKQAGVNLKVDGDKFTMGPLTDNDVKKLSKGAIKNAKRIDYNYAPEKGGLFDPVVTGGLKGENWSHITLDEPVVNPVFENAAKVLLGMGTSEFNKAYKEKGGKYLRDQLNKINVSREITRVKKSLDDHKLTGSHLDTMVKKYKYLTALKKENLKAGEAYTLKNIAVPPPVIRPITIGVNGDIMENDANTLYRNIILHNDSFKKLKKAGISDEDLQENRAEMYNKMKELAGTISPSNPMLKNKGIKGALTYISGNQPKEGFFQKKLIYSKMNLSGRGVIAPDHSLGMDEVGIPEDMAWGMFKPFVIRNLVQMGYGAMQAREAVDNRTAMAKDVLLKEMEKRPMLLNRAPSLWRFSVSAAKPVIRPGNTIGFNTLNESGFNADFDGDAINIHTVVTDDAIEDAKKLMPSKLVFSDRKRGHILQAPSKEAVVGLFMATKNLGSSLSKSSPVKGKFKNIDEAWKAYYAGKIKLTDRVTIG